MNSQDEICGGCVLSSLCKGKNTFDEQGIDGKHCNIQFKRKAVWLMFWIPLFLLVSSLFIMVSTLKWGEAQSFGIATCILTLYYIIIKKTNN